MRGLRTVIYSVDMLNSGTPLYRSLQWLIFPALFIGPLWVAATLIGNGLHVAGVTYGVILVMWLLFFALDALPPRMEFPSG